MASVDRNEDRERDSNPDPITGAPGFHPIGTGVGAAGGGLAGAAAGAAIGSAVPGIGTLIGGVVGTIVGATGGGLAGKGIAEQVDPTAEDAYWRENYKTRPYADKAIDYPQMAPAYRYGWESRKSNPDMAYEQAEPHLEKNWNEHKSKVGLEWDKAKFAVKDAWNRIGEKTGTRKVDQGQTAVPVVEEQLNVGKREVRGGGVRVQTRVEEKPVEAQVNLRDENVRVERRPADRPATDADFANAGGVVEVTERKEVPIVNKEARVVEEVVVDKDAKQRTETVRDTVRRTDVDVERIDKSPDADTTLQTNRSKNPAP